MDGDEFLELNIEVPWGFIASKVKGSSASQPVLCIHGFSDNLLTFVNILPYLPKEKFYVFIDLPGHGRSSHLPVGSFYNYNIFTSVIERIRQYFQWNSFSILGHSLGGNLGGMYSACFPDRVDKVIMLDSFGMLPVDSHENSTQEFIRSSINRVITNTIKTEAKLNQQRVYSYEDVKARLLKAAQLYELTSEGADILLKRGLRRVDHEDVYQFSSDPRMSLTGGGSKTPLLPRDLSCFMLENIKAEVLQVMGSRGIATHKGTSHLCYLFDHYTSSEFYEKVTVDGNHFVHLCQAENVGPHVNRFLQRSQRNGLPRKAGNASKL